MKYQKLIEKSKKEFRKLDFTDEIDTGVRTIRIISHKKLNDFLENKMTKAYVMGLEDGMGKPIK